MSDETNTPAEGVTEAPATPVAVAAAPEVVELPALKAVEEALAQTGTVKAAEFSARFIEVIAQTMGIKDPKLAKTKCWPAVKAAMVEVARITDATAKKRIALAGLGEFKISASRGNRGPRVFRFKAADKFREALGPAAAVEVADVPQTAEAPQA